LIGTNGTKPEQIVLVDDSPTSICETYNLSAVGCFSHFMIFPTLKFNRETSTPSEEDEFELLEDCCGSCFCCCFCCFDFVCCFSCLTSVLLLFSLC